ncbi:MAG: tRNA (adenosine(37)-N6)-dimethylallyltransferase MiaA [Dehalococcoidia bacterium]|nr:tRNA (adenosine(37)-N6)-dimethylallyltransferase MiaA [Dehalococcoidia bacterium]
MNSIGALSAPEPPHNRVLILVGPTAVGKTAVAVELARRLDGEIVGLDSRQIYKYMAVGTVQPTDEEKAHVRHHLIGDRDPSKQISAGEYAELVEMAMDEAESRGKVPIVCGGSGLYYRAVTRGFFDESTSDPKVRAALKERLENEGSDTMLAELKTIDPEYAEIVHPNNHKRLIRALEIIQITGKPPTEHFHLQVESDSKDRFFTVFLRMDIEELTPRIEKRTGMTFENGWIDEVKKLLDLGFDRSSHPMDSLGYRDILKHLEGEMDFEEMVERINIDTRQYARKQLKWFNKERIDCVLEVAGMSEIEVAEKVINQF